MFSIETTISRPVAEVFDWLQRVEDTPLWYSALTSARRLDDGPDGLGARYRFERRLGTADAVNIVRISAFEPERTLELASVSGPTPFIYRYTLMPNGDGTRLRLDGSISGEGLAGALALFSPLAERFFERGMSDNLVALRRLVETASA